MTHLEQLKNISLAFLFREALELGENDPKLISIGMAGGLLLKLFGREWMSKRILNPNNLSFLSDNTQNPLEEIKLQKKILVLGECLYNLKEIDGIQFILKNLQNEIIESIIAELECGRLLVHRGLDFFYKPSTLVKRNDFDIIIKNSPTDIFCEAKCKVESTLFSTSTYSDSLHKAKKQLPKDFPAIIMIKLPYFWNNYERELKNTSEMFVTKTKRALGIVCWYDKWFHIDDTYTFNITTGFEVHNIKSKIINCKIVHFLPTTYNSPKWKSFEQFTMGYL